MTDTTTDGLASPPTVQTQRLRTTNSSITFDPLSVATVLPNPRAHASAVRLYTQQNSSLFRWPYLPMIGGTLPPLGAFVAHLLSTSSSVHPALELAQQDSRKLEVTSNTIFKELPVDFSVRWLGYEIDFRPSEKADNDFMIVNIDGLGGRESSSGDGGRATWGFVFVLVGLSMGAIIAVELVISVFLGDLWATALFFIYACHWLSSSLVASTNMIVKRGPDAIREDDTLCFAVHQRKGGGTIIFKGRKDSLERWARQTWQFDETTYKSTLHWAWISTGSIAAVGSTAAMVNMTAPLQLGFLGLLVLGSLLELALTRISRHLELRPRRANSESFVVKDNRSRTQAIINAAVLPPEKCRLDELNWITLGRLPDQAPFPQMQQMLRNLQRVRSKPEVERAVLSADVVNDFIVASWKDPSDPSRRLSFEKPMERENFENLVNRIASETAEAIAMATHQRPGHSDAATVNKQASAGTVETKTA